MIQDSLSWNQKENKNTNSRVSIKSGTHEKSIEKIQEKMNLEFKTESARMYDDTEKKKSREKMKTFFFSLHFFKY